MPGEDSVFQEFKTVPDTHWVFKKSMVVPQYLWNSVNERMVKLLKD